MMTVLKRSSTTKDVALLQQLHKEGQLKLAPEFQRNSVWPTAAKAYLIDTILSDRPIPILFFQRTTSPQTGRPAYDVIDGQQRLRAVFEFLDNRLRLSETKNQSIKNKRFNDLSTELQSRVLNYDLVIEELSGYSPTDIEDMFVRMNRYVVKLSRQELRHAKEKGAFKEFVEKIGSIGFWRTEKVFSDLQIRRMRAVEFSAELVILLIEGPQDKKKAVDLYYGKYRESFPSAKQIESRLAKYLRWIKRALPDLAIRRYRKPVDLYSLIAALEFVTDDGKTLSQLHPVEVGPRLARFEQETQEKQLSESAARYIISASRQTDNLEPRLTRTGILANILRG
jgi:hypothetical protein